MDDGDGPGLAGTGAHLTEVELRAWTRFLDASRLIEEMLNRHLVDHHNMSHSEYEILVRLDGNSGSMRLTQLADQCVSSKSKLSHTLGRVEKRGWIRRSPSPTDGRGVVATLTASGRDALTKAAIGHAALVKKHLLDVVGADQLPALGDAMDRVSADMRAGFPEDMV